MHLLLINPSTGRESKIPSGLKIGSQLADKAYLGLPLALPTIASLTPPDVEVTIIDEEIEPINFDFTTDLVGITALTYKAKRAYQIAAEFKKRGKYVIMGGIHVSMLPEEALEHVDTVVIGEAESIWAQVIEDFKNHCVQKRYQAERFVDLNDYPLIRRDIIKNQAYLFYMLQTKRGCPYQCKFCSVQKFNGRKVRTTGPEKIRMELENIINIEKVASHASDKRGIKFKDSSTGKVYDSYLNLLIIDDNFITPKEHAREICNVIQEVSQKHNTKISWMGQSDISVAKDDELLQILSQSGCVRLFIGFESLDSDNLVAVRKNCKTSDEYSNAIEKLYSHGIDVVASFVIGNDLDSPESLLKLVEFASQNAVHDMLINILTPYPGTELAKEMEEEGRIISKDWERYSSNTVVIRPPKMTPEELEAVYLDLMDRLYNPKTICAKLIKRDREKLTKGDNILLLEPCPPKFILMFLLTLKAFKILRKERIPFSDIMKMIYYNFKYMYHSNQKISLQTLNGIGNLFDKLHYLWCKKQEARH